MTEPAVTEPAMTAAELDQALSAAGREYAAIARVRPRDEVKLTAIKATIADLQAQQAALDAETPEAPSADE